MNQSALLTITLSIAMMLTACGDKIEPGNRSEKERESIKAEISEAGIQQESFFYEAVANINAHTVSTISAKLMGTVQSVKVGEGDAVGKGDLLVVIDPRTVTSQLEQSEAALREARRAESSAVSSAESAASAAKLASATYQRYRQLLEQNSVSQQEFEEVESRYQQAKAALAQAEAMKDAARSRVQQAQAAVRQASLASKDARVLSPYNGRVVKKMIDAGDLATPGIPLLTIEQEGGFTADLVLPERHIQAVKLGMPVKVRVPSLGNLDISGEIGRIVPAADAQSRSFEVKVNMPENPDLKSGMFARVFIPIGGTDVLSLPQTAIVEEGQLTGVFIVDDRQTARFRLVRTGRILGDQVEIVSGLQQGVKYVVKPPANLKDGMKVEENR